MDMYYWTGFSKRENSTKKPTDTGTKVEILLKEDTSIDNPSIILTGNVFNIDYCYIPDFGKYYFVGSPVILANNMTQYDLIEDCLGTHKTEIGSTVAHIAYSSTGYDANLVDNRIAVKGSRLVYQTSASLGFDSTGCYIVSVTNDEQTGRQGATSYYIMSAYDLYLLLKYMQKDDIFTELKNYFEGSAIDLIQNCIWVPISYATATSIFGTTAQTTFWIGKTEVADQSTTPPTPYLITHVPVVKTVDVLTSGGYQTTSIAIGNKLQDFRDCQPYTSAALYLPGVGQTDLNINDFYGSSNVNIQVIFDITTGDALYKIFDDNNQLMKTLSINTSANVSLAQFSTNIAGVISNIGGAIGGLSGLGLATASGNLFGAASSAFGLLSSASGAVMAANQRSTSVKGANSSRAGFFDSMAVLTLVQLDTEDCDDANYIAKFGRPVGETHAINNHSGYVQCEAASIEIAGDSFERETINRFLNSGFFYE